ncbi:hypothetical protein [Streptomyces triticiradicis]|uniref:Uncharacterized protein n=1 Tax=Streptomyces triticiradicis TaxID=2651189 RepID=A0A7J5D0V3_9ACTN|nr:hypothetical protein [Streptomyces triticiradicis]KAB1971839.1 hypothetical protein F8144_44620 [Streptomyces triticiradicis]
MTSLALLHSLDQLPGPEHLEFPDGFDYPLAKAQANRLRDRLTHDFGRACRLDDQIQDASYYFKVHIPADATESGVPLVVRLSNFGNLAVVTTPRPDSHDDLDQAVQEGALTTANRRQIEAALNNLGYTLVPPRLLHRPYDGVTWLADESKGFFYAGYGPHQGRATWWTEASP